MKMYKHIQRTFVRNIMLDVATVQKDRYKAADEIIDYINDNYDLKKSTVINVLRVNKQHTLRKTTSN